MHPNYCKADQWSSNVIVSSSKVTARFEQKIAKDAKKQMPYVFAVFASFVLSRRPHQTGSQPGMQ